jgi:hypothetical protein
MKAYLANGILLPDLDCAKVYGNYSEPSFMFNIEKSFVVIKCELLTSTLEMDINIQDRKANVFLHFDHPEFDPTANTEVFNSIELEFSYNEGVSTNWEDEPTGKHCKDLYVETINRNYKMEHLSKKVQEEIIDSITKAVDEYLADQKFKY